MPTTNLSMTLPTVSVTVGPTYATQVNAAFDVVDAHDHTSGKGLRITPAAMTIDANIAMGGYSLTGTRAVVYTQQASFATANSLYFKTDGFLYARTTSGEIQLTTLTALNAAALVTAVYPQLSVSTNHTIVSTDAYTHFKISTAAARTITLPLAADVGAGRFYLFSDITGTAITNPITVDCAGSDTLDDGGVDFTIAGPFQTAKIISDGVSKWQVEHRTAEITGYDGNVYVRTSNIKWRSTTSSPTLTQADQAVTNDPGKVLTVTPQTGNGTGTGGALALTGGTGGATGVGGAVSITGGTAGGGSTLGGAVAIAAGASSGTAAGASVTVTAAAASTAGNGGNVTVTAGAGVGASGSGGSVLILSGAGAGTGITGGVGIGDLGGANQVYVGQVSTTRRVVAIGLTADNVDATAMPGGDGVLFVCNGTSPAASAASEIPVNGWVLGSDSGRPMLKIAGSFGSGQRFIIDGTSTSAATLAGNAASSVSITDVNDPIAFLQVIVGSTTYKIPMYT